MQEQKSVSDMQDREQGFFTDSVHAVEGIGAVAVAYNLLAHSLNGLFSLLATGREALALPLLFDYGFFGGYGIIRHIFYCFFAGFITYVVLKLVCRSVWVLERVRFHICLRVLKWYFPWTWIWVCICFVKEVCRWVLKWICRWVAVVVTVPVFICVLVAIVIYFRG